MQAMTWIFASTYEGNINILEGLIYKFFVKNKGFLGINERCKHTKVEYIILSQFIGLSIMGHGMKYK
jgi:hypothetical protein